MTLSASTPRSRTILPALLLIAVLGMVSVSARAAEAKPVSVADGQGCSVTPEPPSVTSAPFNGVCEYLATREGVMQAAIYDNKSDQTYLLSTGDDIEYTASIVKVDVLAQWLYSYQRKGMKIPADIPYSIRYLMGRMIQNSDNAATTGLFHFGGGCRTLTRFNLLIPLDDTKVGCESDNYYGWGNTETTAADQLDLMKVFAYATNQQPLLGATKKSLRRCKKVKRPAKRKACKRKTLRKADRMARTPILNQAARNYGLGLMRQVEPDQRFGITCGPWGTTCDAPNWAVPDSEVTVSLKNGWKTLPTCTDPIPQCPWQVNSTGWVSGKGRDYALSVLTTSDPVGTGDIYGFNYGIETIQGISKLVWANLG